MRIAVPITRSIVVLALTSIEAACAARPTRWGDIRAATWPHVRNRELNARFIDGRYPPFPSVGTRDAIMQRHGGPYRVRVQVCVARTGDVALVDVVEGSGDVDVDADAAVTARAWRFRPGPHDECSIVQLHVSSFAVQGVTERRVHVDR